MTDKRMLILPVDVVEKINANRGDMSQADFINLLIDSRLKPGNDEQNFVTPDDLKEFEQGIKDLLRNFLDFAVSYGIELGPKPDENDTDGLSTKLQGLMASHESGGKSKK